MKCDPLPANEANQTLEGPALPRNLEAMPTLPLLPRLAAATLSGLLLLTSVACTSGPSTTSAPRDLTLDEAQSGGTVVIAEGGSLTLDLPVTSGTGYVWEVEVTPSGLLEVPREAITIRGDAAMPGSVTQSRWILTQATVGKGTVEAVYRRPWEVDVPPAKRFSVSVEVESAKVPSRNP